jgi:hypothetical protein
MSGIYARLNRTWTSGSPTAGPGGFYEGAVAGSQIVFRSGNLVLAEVYPQTDWQRCVVHFYRNVFSHVPNGKVAEVARMLKPIFNTFRRAMRRFHAQAAVFPRSGCGWCVRCSVTYL